MAAGEAQEGVAVALTAATADHHRTWVVAVDVVVMAHLHIPHAEGKLYLINFPSELY